MDDIIDECSNIIVQTQLKKKINYDICGCPSCKLRSDDIKVWLTAGPIDLTTDNGPFQSDTTTPPQRRNWLCHGCLRHVSGASCPYCGTKRISNKV